MLKKLKKTIIRIKKNFTKVNNNLNNVKKEIFKIDVSNSNQGLTQAIPNAVNNLMLNKIMDNKNINNTKLM